MSSPHLFPKACIDGREQDGKDGVGLIIHGQKQHKDDDSDQDSDDSGDDMLFPTTTATATVEMDGEGEENATTDEIANTGV